MDWYHADLGYLTPDQSFVLNDVQYGGLRSLPEDERAALGFLPVTFGPKPDERFYWVAEVHDGPSITYTGTPKAVDQLKALKLADLAAKRYAVETGGCLLGDTPTATDRDTQAKVSGAFLAVSNGLPAPLTWKTPQGFVTLDANTLKAVALGIAAHVQDAFANEATHHAAIEALTDAEMVIAYDVSTGWPENP